MNKKFCVLLVLIGSALLTSCEDYVVVERFESGGIQLKCEMRDEVQHGECIAYFKSGKPRYVSNYSNGTLDGLTTYFHPNGSKHWEVDFQNGIKEGKVNYYDSVGQLYQTSEFVNSVLEGTSYEYYSDGAVKTKANYHDGELNGQLLRYNAEGKTVYESHFVAGVLKDYKEYNDQGVLIGEMLKYEISHAIADKKEVEISIDLLNPRYPVMMVEFYDYKSQVNTGSSPNVIETLFSENGNVQYMFELPQGENSIPLTGIIYDMEPVNGGKEVVVRNKIQFLYRIDNL